MIDANVKSVIPGRVANHGKGVLPYELRRFAGGKGELDVAGATLGEVVKTLKRRIRGFRTIYTGRSLEAWSGSRRRLRCHRQGCYSRSNRILRCISCRRYLAADVTPLLLAMLAPLQFPLGEGEEKSLLRKKGRE